VSRTGLAFVLPWLLTVRGCTVALVAEPSARATSLLNVFGNWSRSGRIKLIDADPWALFRAKREIARGSIVVILPETFASGGRRTITPFMKTSVLAPVGVAALAIQSGLPIQPVCVTSRNNGAFVELGPLIEPGAFDSRDEITHALFGQLAAWVLEHPAEWVGWKELGMHIRRTGAL
jgi:lauroyl/myristoyl acyltransferase